MTPEESFGRAFKIAFRDRVNLIDFLEPLTESQARWKPPDGEWSLLEGLEHIMLEEVSFREGILKGLRHAEETGGWNNAPEPPVKMTAEAMRRREQGRVEAPPCLIPRGDGDFDGMRAALMMDREHSREVLLTYRSRGLSQLVIPMSSIYGDLHVYDRIEFCGIHDALHQEQMERVIKFPGFPGGG